MYYSSKWKDLLEDAINGILWVILFIFVVSTIVLSVEYSQARHSLSECNIEKENLIKCFDEERGYLNQQIRDVDNKLKTSEGLVSNLLKSIDEQSLENVKTIGTIAEKENQINLLTERLNAEVKENSELQRQIDVLITNSVPSIPPAPTISQMVSWGEDECKALERQVFSSNKVYRSVEFGNQERGFDGWVYPIEWYRNLPVNFLQDMLYNTNPSTVSSWIKLNYLGVITGHVWMQKDGVWKSYVIVPAHENGIINFYYFTEDGSWVKTENKPEITKYVLSVIIESSGKQ